MRWEDEGGIHGGAVAVQGAAACPRECVRERAGRQEGHVDDP